MSLGPLKGIVQIEYFSHSIRKKSLLLLYFMSSFNLLDLEKVHTINGSGSKFFDPGQVGSIFVAWVGSGDLWFGMENFP